MKPYEYMLATRETVIYPKEVALPYLVLGLTGELGELILTDVADTENFTKETGDIMWYCFRIMDELGFTAKDEWRFISPPTLAAPSTPFMSFVSAYGAVSNLAEVAKKSIRDSNGTVPGDKVLLSYNCVLIVLGLLDGYASSVGLTLEQCAIANIDKLMSRKSRNVIQGSGDDR